MLPRENVIESTCNESTIYRVEYPESFIDAHVKDAARLWFGY